MEGLRRAVLILRYLMSNTDETRVAKTSEIRAHLKENGIETTSRKIHADVEDLIDLGYEIVVSIKNGCPPVYYYVNSGWEVPELQVLIDAVQASSFLDEKTSMNMVRKIAEMAGPVQKEELIPASLAANTIKTDNNRLMYILMGVREAERQGRKISFRYFDYNIDKKRVERNPNEPYILSPYGSLWMNDRYYIVGWSDKYNKVVTFRADRMDIPKITKMKAVPKPDYFDPKKYYSNVFKMYDGPELVVTLICRNTAIGHIIDKFGKDVEIKRVNSVSFRVSVVVCVSRTFFGWLQQYVGEIAVESPGYVVEMYCKHLNEAIDFALSAGRE